MAISSFAWLSYKSIQGFASESPAIHGHPASCLAFWAAKAVLILSAIRTGSLCEEWLPRPLHSRRRCPWLPQGHAACTALPSPQGASWRAPPLSCKGRRCEHRPAAPALSAARPPRVAKESTGYAAAPKATYHCQRLPMQDCDLLTVRGMQAIKHRWTRRCHLFLMGMRNAGHDGLFCIGLAFLCSFHLLAARLPTLQQRQYSTRNSRQ